IASGVAQEQKGLALVRFGVIGACIALGIAFRSRKNTNRSGETAATVDSYVEAQDSAVLLKLQRLDALLAEGRISESEYVESRLRILSE
ncbi:MAG: hypothetical protein EBR84_02155, partial [Actinobacteria bacterium]|nr:hypothetical protein [Actinomycetota bacterium]